MKARTPPPAALFGACLAALALQGCGGGDDPPAPEPVAHVCATTPSVAERTGYPVYEVSGTELTDAALCNIAAHYEAGYAIVGTQDVDPWNDPDPSAVAEFSEPVEAQDPPPDGEILHQVPVHPTHRAPHAVANLEGFVLASTPNSNGEPWECSVLGASQEVVQAGVEDCLAKLRAEAAAPPDEQNAAPQGAQARNASRSAPLNADAGGSVMGDAKLDSSLWTSIGTATKSLKLGYDFLWQHTDVGTAMVTFTVYRLNSAEASDYYLVKGAWSMRPEFSGTCGRTTGCWWYNNHHRLSLSLQRKHGSVLEDGIIEAYAPQTVQRKKTYTAKFGGGLKVGASADKGVSGEGSVSGEISTSYTYDAANILASAYENQVRFELSHATSTGTYGIGADLYDEDPTTIGGITTTVWALYKFPVSNRDREADASIVLNVDDFSGNFGRAADAFYGPVLTNLRDYSVREPGSERAFTRTFSLPHFSVRMQNDAGAYVQPPLDPVEPLRLRRGQTVRFAIDAGGPSDDANDTTHPITLSWQVVNLPSHLVASNLSGSQKTTVSITARQTAVTGTLDYLRFNTSPRGAAPGLQTGDIAVPVLIVD